MPAKKQYVAKLREDQEVADLFVVLMKQLSSGRTGRNYLRLTIGDRTGKIEVRVWEGADELAQRFKQGDVIYVTGLVTSYQGLLQIKATYLEPVEDAASVDWAELLPSAGRPASEMWTALTALTDTVENPYLKALIDLFVTDKEFKAAFCRAPAARAMHHAYIAGLLEHTLGVLRLADSVAEIYPLDRDLLMTGAFMHDIGKMDEFGATAGFDYTDEGRFLGHLVMGVTIIKDKCALIPGFPDELRLHLEHLMVSHHGENEWGSPKRPKTLEALALHAIDNLDAKIAAANEAIAENESNDDEWTGFIRMFDRPLRRTPDFTGLKMPASKPSGGAPEKEAAETAAPAPKQPVEEPATEAEEVHEDGKEDVGPASQGKLF